uniref:Uncharacterized protein n=2 Tax=Brevibacterium sp. Ap13 TaxID=1406197 RepID=U5NVC6_9MICO|nr:hypothetical protein AP13_p00080 [Brevibacterium sp. Ap13]
MGTMARRSKGDRTATTVRFPTEHFEQYRAEAHRQGLELSDYLALIAARAHNLPVPAYLNESQKEVLPVAV